MPKFSVCVTVPDSTTRCHQYSSSKDVFCTNAFNLFQLSLIFRIFKVWRVIAARLYLDRSLHSENSRVDKTCLVASDDCGCDSFSLSNCCRRVFSSHYRLCEAALLRFGSTGYRTRFRTTINQKNCTIIVLAFSAQTSNWRFLFSHRRGDWEADREEE